ncbi:hypothetical protein DRO91_04575 [Candidatus Heimdallarchaeota archaeon]|nr:MAG: hypothetical protein DRO91_04575 [Candidatus Heimdallarchaeota archaeon]
MAKKKKLNKRVVLLLAVFCVIIAICATIYIIQRLPEDPKIYINQAKVALAKSPKNYKDAAKAYGLAIANSEGLQRAEYQYQYAELCFERVNKQTGLSNADKSQIYGSGFGLLRKILQKNPKFLKAHHLLERHLWARASRSRNWKALKDYISTVDRILKLGDNAELYHRRGLAKMLLASSDPDIYNEPTLADLRKAVELAPNEAAYLGDLAGFLSRIERKDEAEEIYAAAIKANPKNAAILRNYAAFLQTTGRKEDAAKAIQAAIAADPQDPQGYISLARWDMQQKKYDQAAKTLAKAKELDKFQIQIYALLARLHRAQNDLPGAAEAIRKGLVVMTKLPEDKAKRMNPTAARATLNFWLADVLLRIYDTTKDDQAGKDKALAEARQCYDNLLKLSPQSVSRYKISGQLAYIDKDWNLARQDLEKVLSAGQLNMILALRLIDVYQRLQMPGAAENLVARVLQMPNLTEKQQAYFFLRLARFRMYDRNYVSARNYVDRVIRLDPGNKEAGEILSALDVAEGKSKTLPKTGQAAKLGRAMLLRRAQDMVLQDDYARAIPLLEQIYAQDSKNYRILAMLAMALDRTKQQERALQLIRQASSASPDNEDLKRWEKLLQESDPKKREQIEMQFAQQVKDPLNRALQKWNVAKRYGKADDAMKYLKEAEKIDPTNRTVLATLTNLAVQKKDWPQAQALAERVQKTDQTMGEIFKAQILIAQDKHKDAIPLLNKILKDKSYLRVARLMLANCYAKMDKPDKAKAQYEICIGQERSDIAAIVGMAKLAAKQNNIEEHNKWIKLAYRYPAGKGNRYVRDQYLRQAIDTKDPKTAIARREKIFAKEKANLDNALRLAGLYERTGQTDKARKVYEYIYGSVEQKVRFAPTLANFYRRAGQADQADALFGKLLERTTEAKAKSAAYVAYGNFLAGLDPKSARAMYQKAIDTDKSNSRAYRALADIAARQAQTLTRQGKGDQARAKWKESIAILRELVDKNPADLSAKKTLYRQYINAAMLAEATLGFQDMLAKYPNDAQAMLGLGLARLREDKLNEAEKLFRRAIKLQPDLAEAHVFLSEVHQAHGDLFSAVEEINKAVAIRPSVPLRMDLARLQEAMDKPGEASRTYDTIISQAPSYLPAYRRLLNLWSRQGKWDALEALAKAAQSRFPNTPEFSLDLASMWARRGNPALQIKSLESALAVSPENTVVVRRYLYALAKAGQYDKLTEKSKKYLNRPEHKSTTQAILAYAQAKQLPGAFDQTFGEFLSILKQIKNPSDIFFVMILMQESYGLEKLTANSAEIIKAQPGDWQVRVAIGDAQAKLDKNAQAEKTFKSALPLCDNALARTNVLRRLGTLYEKTTQPSKTEAVYKEIIKLNPNSVAALNNLAYLYVDTMDRPADALPLVQKALQMQSGNPNLIDTYAWTLIKLGRLEEAREALSKLLHKNITGADILYHMGYVMEKTNDLEGARGYYKNALDQLRRQKDSPLRKTVQAALARVEDLLKKKE